MRSHASRHALPALFLLLAISGLATLYFHLSWALAIGGSELPGGVAALAAGEVALVASAIVSPLSLRTRPAPLPLALASLVTILVAGLGFSTSILPLVATWSLGLSLFLPLPVYLGAVWCASFALISAAAGRASRREAAVLFLVLAAGRTWAATYNGLLAASAGAAAGEARPASDRRIALRREAKNVLGRGVAVTPQRRPAPPRAEA